MAQMNYDDFVKMTAKQPAGGKSSASRIRYFALTDDGDTALVRFNIADIEDVKVIAKHRVTAGGKARNVECLRTPADPLGDCPLCQAGERATYRVLIPLVVYETDDNGVEAVPYVWEQAPKIREMLKSFAMDYGDLRDYLFKIVRHGRHGDTNTTYTIIPANMKMYSADVYAPDFSAFENYSVNNFILSKTAEEMQEFLDTGNFPNPFEKKEVKEAAPSPKYDDRPTPTQRIYSAQQEEKPQTTTGPRRYTY